MPIFGYKNTVSRNDKLYSSFIIFLIYKKPVRNFWLYYTVKYFIIFKKVHLYIFAFIAAIGLSFGQDASGEGDNNASGIQAAPSQGTGGLLDGAGGGDLL